MMAAQDPWSVPIRLEDVPESGRQVELDADAAARAAVASQARVDAVERLFAVFDLTRRGRDKLHAAGRVRATIRQTCVVTLEPVVNEVDEEIDVTFGPTPAAVEARELELAPASQDPPEPLRNGAIDLGALATEFLILGIDPYPRKAGVTFEPPQVADSGGTAFEALAALKKANKVKE